MKYEPIVTLQYLKKMKEWGYNILDEDIKEAEKKVSDMSNGRI